MIIIDHHQTVKVNKYVILL